MRTATIQRKTNETNITATVNLDGTGKHEIETGVGFLDHMLTHIAVHGVMDLTLKAQGDLQVDEHHTIEDVAIVLGQAIDKALGDRKGIVRMGSAYVPMDETLGFVAIDLSGRPYGVVQAEWNQPMLGTLPTTLIPHFFESMSVSLRANVHARVIYGRDDHHKLEALFKALGRALAAAVLIDPRRAGQVPSTKGSL
jgi:imidazoleglycerol-phosphate dehydratase